MFRRILIVIGILLIVGGYFGYKKYQDIFAGNVPVKLEQPYVNIPTGATYEEVLALLKNQEILIDWKSFDWLAEQMKYKRPEMRAGSYKTASLFYP